MRINVLSLFIVCCLLASCDQKKSLANKTKVNNVEVVDEQDGDLLIYERFEDMEYIFNNENDTTYVINFWATWCKPCVEELPYFDQLFTEYRAEKIKIILVSLDFPKQIESKLKPYLLKNKVLPQVMVLKDGNANEWIGQVSEDWDGAIPATIIYNKNKRLFIGGEVPSYANLKDKVEPLINN